MQLYCYSSTLAKGGSDNGEIVKAGGEDHFLVTCT